MNKRIAKKKAKALMKQEKPFVSAKEIKALSKQKVLESLRAPEFRSGKLDTRGKYFTAIKKYHDYINKGLIKESSILDKYEAADAFTETLSPSELSTVLKEGEKKEALIQAHDEALRARRKAAYDLIDF